MPRYLQKRRRRWYAVLEVPVGLRAKFGRRLVKSLETESLTVAEKRVLGVVADWRRRFDTHCPMQAHIDAMQRYPDLADDYIDVHLGGITYEEERILSDAVRVTRGDILLSLHIDEYISSIAHLQKKTQDMRRRDIRLFCNRFKFAHDATKIDVTQWVEGLDVAPATGRRIIGACRGYWGFLERRKNLTIPHPFTGVVVTQKKTVKRRAFRPQDLGVLLAHSEDETLNNLILLGAYTGARIEELCSLKLVDVSDDRFHIEDAKTEAANRIVPIHEKLLPLVAHLRETSQDGYLLSGLTYNKYGDRSNALGKRFGRLKAKAGYDETYVFHSLRKGFVTQLEAHGVPEFETARLVGHEIPTITYGLYSGGHARFERLKEVINLVVWNASPC